MQTYLYIVFYLIVVNLLGFTTMGIDKRRAERRLYRISEATLFIVAILGGSLGSIIGMRIFHHKTRHWYFVFGMPAIFIIETALVLFFLFNPFFDVRIM